MIVRESTSQGTQLSGKRLVRETSGPESDCPGNVCKAISTVGYTCSPVITSAKEGGCVIVAVRLFVCLSVRPLATLCKNFWSDLHEIFREGWQWLNSGGDPDPYPDPYGDSGKWDVPWRRYAVSQCF